MKKKYIKPEILLIEIENDNVMLGASFQHEDIIIPGDVGGCNCGCPKPDIWNPRHCGCKGCGNCNHDSSEEHYCF